MLREESRVGGARQGWAKEQEENVRWLIVQGQGFELGLGRN